MMIKKKKFPLILISIFLGVVQDLYASQDCTDFFTQVLLNTPPLKKISPKLSKEIRSAYSTYLKEVDPVEQNTVISLIVEAEEKFSRSRVQAELKSAINQCSIDAK